MFHRPVAHVLDAQRGCNDEHLVQRLAIARLQDHAANARVQRQFGQLGAHGRQLVVIVHRAQLAEQGIAVGDRLGPRWLQEGELIDLAEAKALHAQDDPGQR